MSSAGPAGLDVVDRTIGLTEASDRPDLGQRLAHTRRRLLDPTVRVLVVGEFKQGKSLLVNALIDAAVCPVDDDIATAVPTEISYDRLPTRRWCAGEVMAPAQTAQTARRPPESRSPLTRSPVTCPRRATGLTRKACCAPRSVFPGRFWPAGWSWSTRPAWRRTQLGAYHQHPGCAAHR